MTNKSLTVGLIAVLIIAIGGYFLLHGGKDSFGNVAPTDITATNYTEVTASVGMQTPVFQLGGVTSATSVNTRVSAGSCNTATSTAFAVTNPYGASSTAHLIITIGAQATSSALQVGTTTQSVGLSFATVSNNLASTTIATSSPATYLVSGANTAYSGQTGNYEIVVGPTGIVGAYSTSTYGAAGAVNYTPTSCTYKIKWTL